MRTQNALKEKEITVPESLTVRDGDGDVVITLADMKKYHGKDFWNGLAQAFRVMQLAFRELLDEGEVAERDRIRLVLGLSPPGIMDGFEYITRAVTRNRVIIDAGVDKGPESYNGRYYFEVHYGSRMISMWLKEDILPDGYTAMARQGFARLLDDEAMAHWSAGKKLIADRVMAGTPEEVFEIGEIRR